MPVKLGYWGFRGLAQTSRHLLSYTETDFEDVVYKEAEKWHGEKGDKKELGISFPNLPYLIDGDFNITESSAVERYIINRSGKKELLGKNTRDKALVEELLGVFLDANGETINLFFNKDHEAAKLKHLEEKVRPKFTKLSQFIG